MDNYLKQLTCIIKNSDSSIYAIATEIGIDRSYLSKMLSGKRTMSIDVLCTLLKTVCKDSAKREEIVNLYIHDVFGAAKFEKYCSYLSNSFLEKASFEETILGFKIPDYVEFDSRIKLLICAANMMSHEKAPSRIFTNFPITDFLEIAKRQQNCDYRCIISSNSKDKNTSVFDQMKLVFLNCVCYANENDEESIDSNDFCPYIIIANDGVLFASDDLESGYYLRNSQLADFYAAKFESKCNQLKSCALVHNDVLEIRDTVGQLIDENIATDRVIETHFSAVSFMDLDDWDELARDDLPEREYLKAATYSHYKKIFDCIDFHDVLTTRNGLIDFCENGTVYEVPANYCKPLSIKTKIVILERMRDCIINNPNKFSMRLIKNNSLDKANDSIYIQTFTPYDENHRIALQASKKDKREEDDLIGKYYFSSTDRNTVENYNEFFDLFKMSDRVMSAEESLTILEDAIVRLKLKES